MKILFCTNKFEEVSNGPAKFANLILDINNLYPEHEIRILTEDISEPRPYVYRLDLKHPKALRLFSHYFRIRQYHRTATKLRKKEYPFDVIVYNNAFIGLRSTLVWRETIGMVNDYNNACRTWSDFKFNYLFIKQFLFKQLERFTLKQQHIIIVNSLFLSNFLARAYDIPTEKFRLLYKGLETPESINQLVLDSDQTIRVLFVKADYLLGGLSLLISALGNLNYSFHLTVIGPPDNAETFIQEKVNFYSNISLDFKGYQAQTTVFQELLKAHLYISPAYREALGVANLEAMSHGVPVITTEVGGIPEALNYGKCGWLVPPGDAQTLSAAIQECIENTSLRKQKIQAGLNHCKQFSKEQVLHNFLAILSEAQGN